MQKINRTHSYRNASGISSSIFLIIADRIFQRFLYIPLYAIGFAPLLILVWEIDPNSTGISLKLHELIATLAGRSNADVLTEIDIGKAVAIVFIIWNAIFETYLAITGKLREGILIKTELIIRAVIAEIAWLASVLIAIIRNEPIDQAIIPFVLALFWPFFFMVEYVMRMITTGTLVALRSGIRRV